MAEITDNEMKLVLTIFKSPEKDYNAYNLAKEIGLSAMGAFKILKRLEKEEMVIPKQLANATFYKLNLDSDYVRQYVKFLLKREAEQAHPYVKVWISEIRKIKNADAAILFGSVLRKHKEARDIDAVLITDQKRFSRAEKEIEEINNLNVKKIQPVFQSQEDFIKNINKGDKVLLNALKGIVAFGEDLIIEMMKQ